LPLAAGEIIDNPKLSKQDSALNLVLKEIRIVGEHSLDAVDDESKQLAARVLRRILRLYERPAFRRVANVPGELLRFFLHVSGKSSMDITEPKVLEFLRFVAGDAIPRDVLRGLSMVEGPPQFQPELFPVLQTLLTRGASSGNELSASLLRIKQSRQRLDDRMDENSDNLPGDGSQSIWKQMSSGMVAMEK